MRRALELARRGWGQVSPNPLVGAVLVRDGQVVGEGHHARYGEAHAEVEALRAAGERARGADLYVTLEPCHHRGKTGPCSAEIVRAGVARVVYAVADPSPIAGGAATWLQDQGVRVEAGVCAEEARELNAAHLTAIIHDRPFVALKYAMSLDARLAERPGRPSQVTRGAAIGAAHRLRAGHDAVMVGIGTVLADDPRLTVREWKPPRVPPLRAVVDTRLRTPPDSNLARSSDAGPVRVFAGPDAPAGRARALEERGVEVVRVPRAEDGLELSAVLAELREGGIQSVLCEGGGRLGSALLAAGLVDRIYAFIAPRLFGEPGVPGFVGARGRARRDWRLVEREALGATTLLTLSSGVLHPN